MIAELIQPALLNERLQALRDRFATGSGWGEVIAVLLVLAGCVLLLVLLHRLQHPGERREPDDPHRLFRGLLTGLNLTAEQRRILRNMATDLRLEHPAIILLSPELFREQASKWSKTRGNTRTAELRVIAQRLFQHTSVI